MNDWQKFFTYLFGVKVTQRGWAVSFAKDLAKSALELIAVVLGLVLLAVFVSADWAGVLFVIYFFYKIYNGRG